MFCFKKIVLTVPIFILCLFVFSTFANAESKKTGVVLGENLNVREEPDLSAKVLTQFSKGTKVQVIGESGDWYNITYNDINGWVYGEYLSVRDEIIGIGTIGGNDVNVRTEPDLSSEVITKLDKGEKVNVLDRSGDWYKIQLLDDKTGWVFKQYILVRDQSTSRGITEDITPSLDGEPPAVEDDDTPDLSDDSDSAQNDDSIQQKLIDYAKKYLGVKYVYGGTSPKGFDCSGFVQYVYKHFDITLERVAENQAKHGTKVAKKDLKIGDLVFFDTNGGRNSIEHVGIYIGGGKFIHASSGRTKRKVVISDITTGYYADCFMQARRYLK